MDRKKMVSSLVEYYTNGNKSQFAKMLGITPQTINTWISRNTFNAELIYAKCEGVSANWLLTGCGSMINEQEREVNASLQVQEKFPLKTDNLIDLQRIPLYNLEATAGLVSLFNDVDAIPISYIVAGSACMRWGCLCARGFDVPITQKRRYCPLQTGA